MVKKVYNNDFYCSTALMLVLLHRNQWKLSEIALILPLVTQKRIVDTVNRKRKDFSLFDLIIDKPQNFYNFNLLFDSFRNTTLNSLFLLIYSGIITFDNNTIQVAKNPIDANQIKRLIKGNKKLVTIEKNSDKFAELIKDKSDIAELYTMLGVSL
ncbi:hypothetical protein G8C15_06875 [Enterococcus casseliflavus]|nr:hypothetical protein [Enterococcus casseliflavus]